ncbi:MAG: radical SAM protein [Candidatus Moranbacteria bacterium]|nr:radical SAM protein [Candidatus Moranbacteria bacterium]
MKNSISEKSVQHGLERKNNGNLQTMWIELPGICNLACAYCYACGGDRLCSDNLLSWQQYKSILVQARALGVDSIGIPGAGEPLLGTNRQLALSIIRKCSELGIFVTLFTTGEFIDERIADELYRLPVEVMLKGNTLDPEKQDRFVSDPSRNREIRGYGEKRNVAIDLLMRKGFNDHGKCMKAFGRKSRMALVTSIMTGGHGELNNLDDVVGVLRYCREHNIIFDCDSLLERGRGANCELCASDRELKSKLLELQEIDDVEYGNVWGLSQSYVGTVCDRYMHHLYVTQYGEVRPCIGAMDMMLGDLHETTLQEAWESAEMRIIRARKYSGKCGDECGNFEDGTCNSCLGRRVSGLTNENLLAKGSVDTVGCWNFRDKT